MSAERDQDTKDNAGSAEPQDKQEPGTTEEAPQWRSHILPGGTEKLFALKYSLGQQVDYKEGRSKTGPWKVKQLNHQNGTYDIAKGSDFRTNVPEANLSRHR